MAGCLVKGNPRVTSAYVVISSALENRVKIGVAETSQVYLKFKCTWKSGILENLIVAESLKYT